ncbi:MAG: macrodomain Ter protein organizer (MatP/YcbG family) [Candidatus Nitrosomirales archaeon]|jgi:macrodomain Ter protein organizer (MatP/YcbG family)
MKVISTKLSNPEWEQLVDKCNERGITLAEYIRELIKNDSTDKKPVESEVKNNLASLY